MEQVKLYDTTLRDGMQGEGMSLSASEKARVVQAKFRDALEGRAEEYLEWLDFVEAPARADESAGRITPAA